MEYFFREYTDVLYYRAFGFVKDNLAAEDIVQEVFIRFWQLRKNLKITDSRLFVQGSGPSLPQLSRAFESETSLRGKSEMGRGDGGGFGG